MGENKILLSIVIPTKNRAIYALDCITSILRIDSNQIEVIVHDNSDNYILRDKILCLQKDKRLKYFYNSEKLNTIHNFNECMNFVNGYYTCYIGDDDCVDSELINLAKWGKKNNFEAISYKTSTGFSWPGVKKANSGVLKIHPFTSKYKIVNVEKELSYFLNDGGVYYLNHKLPKVYHGLIKTSTFKKCKLSSGNYFGGLSPDIYASISISTIVKKLAFFDYPYTIAGSSKASDKTHRTKDAKYTELKDAPHFKNRGMYEWSENVPKVYSAETIWAESSIKALEDNSKKELIKTIHIFKMLTIINNSIPDVFNCHIKDFILKNNINIYILTYYNYLIKIKSLYKKIKSRIYKIITFKKSKFYYDFQTISEAMEMIEKVNHKLKPDLNKINNL